MDRTVAGVLEKALSRLFSEPVKVTAAGRTDSGVADLVQELLPVLRDARSVVANLRDATDELRRYPAQTLLAEPPPRPRDKAK